MKLFSIFILAVWHFAAAPAMAADETHLLGLTAADKGGKTYIQLQMSKSVPWGQIEAHFLRRTVEWDLKGIQLKKDKIFQKVNSNNISNVYVSQSDDKTTRVRVNLDNGVTASDFHERVSFFKKGDQITMVMDPATALSSASIKEMNKTYSMGSAPAEKLDLVTQLSAGGTATTAVETKDIGTIPPSPEVMADDAAPIAVIDDNKAESEIPLEIKKANTDTVGAPSLGRMAIGLAAALLLGASIFLVGKKINKKRLSAPFAHDSIKVISQKYLGPKRNLTLVRVAGEYMLLGVTDNNISLIKTLSLVDDEIPELSPNDFGTAIKNMTKSSQASQDESADDVEDTFSVSSLSDVKNIMKKRKYIDEADL